MRALKSQLASARIESILLALLLPMIAVVGFARWVELGGWLS